MNVLVLNLELEYQMHLLQMEFATMKQIPLTVGLMDLIVVYQMLLISTAQNVLVTVSVFLKFPVPLRGKWSFLKLKCLVLCFFYGFWAKKLI